MAHHNNHDHNEGEEHLEAPRSPAEWLYDKLTGKHHVRDDTCQDSPGSHPRGHTVRVGHSPQRDDRLHSELINNDPRASDYDAAGGEHPHGHLPHHARTHVGDESKAGAGGEHPRGHVPHHAHHVGEESKAGAGGEHPRGHTSHEHADREDDPSHGHH